MKRRIKVVLSHCSRCFMDRHGEEYKRLDIDGKASLFQKWRDHSTPEKIIKIGNYEACLTHLLVDLDKAGLYADDILSVLVKRET